MEAFESINAVAVPIDMDDVDTDQIIPARLTRRSRRERLHGTYLFRDLRFNEDGTEKPDFILNHLAFRNARIVIASKNYACGSSRPGAVYVHYDYGIRVVIAESFGDVFYNTCFKNGLLPVRLDERAVTRLRSQLYERPGATVCVDLERQIVTGPDGSVYHFEVDAFAKHCLLNAVNDIALTLEEETKIAAFEQCYYQRMPWLRQ
jgi:3-isopropylmalate/(R)-2-methylmalate dehydratase small subunit